MQRRINLVPLSERTRTTTDVGLLLMLVAAIVVVFALAFGYYLLDNQREAKQQQLADLRQQVAQIEDQVAALQQYERIKVQRDQMEGLVTDLYSTRTQISDLLNDISLVVPDTIWFQDLSLTATDPRLPSGDTAKAASAGDGKISIQATTYTFEEVAGLLVRLQLVPSLRDVVLMNAAGQANEAAGQEIKTFSMQGAVIDTTEEDDLPVSDIQVETP